MWLRKSNLEVYFQYSSTGDSINCNRFEVEQIENVAVLSMVVSPVDSNQQSDAERLDGDEIRELKTVTILEDAFVKRRFEDFLRHNGKISVIQLKLKTKKQWHRFEVTPHPYGKSGIQFAIHSA